MLLCCPYAPLQQRLSLRRAARQRPAPEGRSTTPAYGLTVVPRILSQCLTAQQGVLSHSQSSHGGCCRQQNVSRLLGICHMGSVWTCSRLRREQGTNYRSVRSNVPAPGCEPRPHLWLFAPHGVSVWQFGQDQPLLSTCCWLTAGEIYRYRFLIRAKCDQTLFVLISSLPYVQATTHVPFVIKCQHYLLTCLAGRLWGKERILA